MDDGPTTVSTRHDGLLGTTIEVRVTGGDRSVCAAVDATVVSEIERLAAVFNAYDDASELSRWKRGELAEPSPEFVEVMAAAAAWQRRSAGRFNPMSGLISATWRRAADRGERPDAAELRRLAASIAEPRFDVVGGIVRPLGDCSDLNLNAIAKGFVVDRATTLAFDTAGPSMVLVSAGGDLVHRGDPPARVGIENPLRPFDNEPPLTVIEVDDAGVATSGGARRQFRVGGERFSHVIDPRTGEPVRTQASVTVVAVDAMTADVMATVLGLDEPRAAIESADTYQRVACLVVDPDGHCVPNTGWTDRFGAPATIPPR